MICGGAVFTQSTFKFIVTGFPEQLCELPAEHARVHVIVAAFGGERTGISVGPRFLYIYVCSISPLMAAVGDIAETGVVPRRAVAAHDVDRRGRNAARGEVGSERFEFEQQASAQHQIFRVAARLLAQEFAEGEMRRYVHRREFRGHFDEAARRSVDGETVQRLGWIMPDVITVELAVVHARGRHHHEDFKLQARAIAAQDIKRVVTGLRRRGPTPTAGRERTQRAA